MRNTNNQHWNSQFQKLQNHANGRGWQVKVGRFLPNTADEAKSLVTIQKTTPEMMVYYLIHEMGHMLLFFSNDYSTRFRNFAEARDRKAYGTAQYRVGKVEEELAAWDEGLNLATLLGISVDEKKFNKLKTKCITSYMVWAVKRQTRKEQNNEQHTTTINS